MGPSALIHSSLLIFRPAIALVAPARFDLPAKTIRERQSYPPAISDPGMKGSNLIDVDGSIGPGHSMKNIIHLQTDGPLVF